LGGGSGPSQVSVEKRSILGSSLDTRPAAVCGESLALDAADSESLRFSEALGSLRATPIVLTL
jgi:hypothetical protein